MQLHYDGKTAIFCSLLPWTCIAPVPWLLTSLLPRVVPWNLGVRWVKGSRFLLFVHRGQESASQSSHFSLSLQSLMKQEVWDELRVCSLARTSCFVEKGLCRREKGKGCIVFLGYGGDGSSGSSGGRVKGGIRWLIWFGCPWPIGILHL